MRKRRFGIILALASTTALLATRRRSPGTARYVFGIDTPQASTA